MSGFPFSQFTVVLATTNTTNNSTFTSAAMDSIGGKAMRVIVKLGAIAAGATMTVCKLQSSSTSGGTYADVTGAALTAFPADTDDNKLIIFEFDLLNGSTKDRFYKLVVTTGGAANSAIDTVIAEVLNLSVEPPSAANTASGAFVVRF